MLPSCDENPNEAVVGARETGEGGIFRSGQAKV